MNTISNRYSKPLSRGIKIGASVVAICVSVLLIGIFSLMTRPIGNDYHTTSFKVKSDNEVIVGFSFTGHIPTVCAVRVLGHDMSTVGWKVVPVLSPHMEVGLRTTKVAHHAEIESCRRIYAE
ncbi:DUF4307 domain-containing protein [Tropheryma whipplei]|nr:DUF4307 domain-containing protein [Tropheryma whipplei]